jgi:hypothetical protein
MEFGSRDVPEDAVLGWRETHGCRALAGDLAQHSSCGLDGGRQTLSVWQGVRERQIEGLSTGPDQRHRTAANRPFLPKAVEL